MKQISYVVVGCLLWCAGVQAVLFDTEVSTQVKLRVTRLLRTGLFVSQSENNSLYKMLSDFHQELQTGRGIGGDIAFQTSLDYCNAYCWLAEQDEFVAALHIAQHENSYRAWTAFREIVQNCLKERYQELFLSDNEYDFDVIEDWFQANRSLSRTTSDVKNVICLPYVSDQLYRKHNKIGSENY